MSPEERAYWRARAEALRLEARAYALLARSRLAELRAELEYPRAWSTGQELWHLATSAYAWRGIARMCCASAREKEALGAEEKT